MSTRPTIGPANPDASNSRNAPSRGEPNRVLMAAKLPAAAMTVATMGGASLAARWTANTPRPPPIRMSGASGPNTMPRERVAKAARNTPGSQAGSGVPPAWKPSAGSWPPPPGRYLMVRLTTTPASTVGGIGHQTGTVWKPRSPGSVEKTQVWHTSTSFRKP